MGEIVSRAVCGAVGQFFLLVWILPAGLIFLAYLIYIIVMTVKEFRKK